MYHVAINSAWSRTSTGGLLCAPEWVGQIAVLLTKGAIKLIVDRIFPVANFQSGIEYSEAGRDWGKIVVRLVDSLENVEHPLNKWIRTGVPVRAQ